MKVTVVIHVYNREKYIAEALDSILMQETDFDYEVVIGEDCSTDASRDIVIEYQKRHPDKIRLLLHEQNLGYIENWLACFRNARGEYIANLDSDDYWTAKDKLQKQAEYLDKNQDCSACSHMVKVFSEDGSIEPYTFPHFSLRRKLFLEDLLNSVCICTSSIMLRRRALDPPLMAALSQSVIGDWELFTFLAERGSIGYVDEEMSVYRMHAGGMYAGAPPIEQINERIKLFQYLNGYFKGKYRKTYTEQISKCHHALALEYIRANDFAAARGYFLKSVLKCPFNKRKSRAEVIKTCIRLFFPPLFRLLKLRVNQDPSLF